MSRHTPVDFGTFWIFWIPERRGVAVFWLNWLTLENLENFKKKESISRHITVDFGTIWILERWGVAVFWLNWLTLEEYGKSGKISKKKKYVSPISS